MIGYSVLRLLQLKKDLLLVAPPAWGKTRLLIQMVKQSEQRWVFISPLRALANEFYQTMNSIIDDCVLIQHRDAMTELKSFKFLVVTPEVCHMDVLERWHDLIVVFDEFHLIYYWGDDFRPVLLECFHWASCQPMPKLYLSGTMPKHFLQRLSEECPGTYFLDVGNQKLKNYPLKTYGYLPFQKSMMVDNLVLGLNESPLATIIFCKYRNQVDQWVQFFQQMQISALGCVGGEASYFQLQLQQTPGVKVIVATTVLGHGVNLPAISRVFFTYQVENLDFWVQMAGRAGRRGEKFYIHTMDFYADYGRKWIMLFNTVLHWLGLKVKHLIGLI